MSYLFFKINLNLIQNVYTELARQLETAKLDDFKNTTIKNPIMPTVEYFLIGFNIIFIFIFYYFILFNFFKIKILK